MSAAVTPLSSEEIKEFAEALKLRGIPPLPTEMAWRCLATIAARDAEIAEWKRDYIKATDANGPIARMAVDAEREACAKVAEAHHCALCGPDIADAIRARGKEQAREA
jgi:sugar phosphate isomerase/epimerase